MSADALLNLVEQRGMLPEKLVARLRQQVAQQPKQPAPDVLARMLVQRGHLTVFQAKQLLTELRKSSPEVPAEPAAEVDELDLAPLDDEPAVKKPSPPAAVDGLTPIDEPAPPPPPPPVAADALTPIDTPDALTPIDEPAAHDPLADLSEVDAESAAAGSPLIPSKPKKKGLGGLLGKRERRTAAAVKKKTRDNVWDSPLLLIGGGGLLLLLMVGALLGWVIFRTGSDELFAQAQSDYEAQAYTQAIDHYETFIRKFPRHPKASLAKVRHALARLRQAIETNKNWNLALTTAGQILPEIEQEEAFGEARPELASLLPDIVAGFAELAKHAEETDQKQQFIDRAADAMKLVDNSNYLPTSLRKSQQSRIEGIQADIALVQRDIDRARQLHKAVEEIQQATESGDTATAYRVRRELLLQFPRLAANPELQEVVLAISRKQRQQVEVVQDPTSAATDDPPTAAEFRLAFAPRRGEAAPAVANRRLFYHLHSAVWALDAASGRLLWRRPIGPATSLPPLPVGVPDDQDVVVIDSRTWDVVRLRGETGELQWRLPLGEPLLAPQTHGNRLFVATHSGRVFAVDAATGEAAAHAVLPQPLSAAPGIDDREKTLLLAAEHSNLYVLDVETLACVDVAYVGHDEGGVLVPPIASRGVTIVAETAGVKHTRLHVVVPGEEEGMRTTLPQPIRLDGRTIAPMRDLAGHVLATTDRGSLSVLQIDPSDEQPVRVLADAPGALTESVFSYPLYNAGRLWVGNVGLAKYDLQASRGQLVFRWQLHEQDAFAAPLAMHGQAVFHARRRTGSPGIVVSAARADGGADPQADGQTVWQTDLAVPAIVDATTNRINVITALGDVFRADAEALRAGVADTPLQRINVEGRTPKAFPQRIALGDGRMALAGDAAQRELLLVDASAEKPLNMVTLQLPADVRTGPIASLAGGLLVPANDGRVYLFDVETGTPSHLPFQPPLGPDDRPAWSRPVDLGTAQPQFAVADGQGALYRVEIRPTPRPHLALSGRIELAHELAAPMAVLGTTLLVPQRTDTADTVVALSVPDLKHASEWPLQGRVAWGPVTVGDAVLLATDADGLVCLGPEPSQRWKAPLDQLTPVGQPIAADGTLIVATESGRVLQLDAANGAVQKEVDVGEPLADGPWVMGQRLLLIGADGTLHVVKFP